jgi:hypothetical protein
MRYIRWIGGKLLALILLLPFILGALIGFLGLCYLAFLHGFYSVYPERE